MNALEKQVSRIPQHFRDKMSQRELEAALTALNAMNSANRAGGDTAIKKWAKKNMTAAQEAALVTMAAVGDAHEGNDMLAPLVKIMLKMIR